MKNAFLSIALLLAAMAAATAQPQTDRLPVMCLGDPDLYLELKHRPGFTADTVPAAMHTTAQLATTAPRRAQGPNPGQDPLPTHLLYTAMWEDYTPDKFMEEMGHLYGTGEPLTPAQFERLVLQARVIRYLTEE